jgi:hypothetical protein
MQMKTLAELSLDRNADITSFCFSGLIRSMTTQSEIQNSVDQPTRRC